MKLLLATLAFALPLAGETPKCPPLPTHIDIGSGTFSAQPGVSFRLTHFVATLVPRAKTDPFCYQKTTVVSHADIFASNESLSNVFASKLGDANSRIKNFKVVNGEARVTLTGSLTRLIPIAFAIEGPVTTDGTTIRLTADKIKADGIPVKALLALLGEHLSNVLKIDGVGGVTVEDNTLAFDPEQIAHIKGHLSSVQATPAGLTLHYTRAPRPAGSRPAPPIRADASR